MQVRLPDPEAQQACLSQLGSSLISLFLPARNTCLYSLTFSLLRCWRYVIRVVVIVLKLKQCFRFFSLSDVHFLFSFNFFLLIIIPHTETCLKWRENAICFLLFSGEYCSCSFCFRDFDLLLEFRSDGRLFVSQLDSLPDRCSQLGLHAV